MLWIWPALHHHLHSMIARCPALRQSLTWDEPKFHLWDQEILLSTGSEYESPSNLLNFSMIDALLAEKGILTVTTHGISKPPCTSGDLLWWVSVTLQDTVVPQLIIKNTNLETSRGKCPTVNRGGICPGRDLITATAWQSWRLLGSCFTVRTLFTSGVKIRRFRGIPLCHKGR